MKVETDIITIIAASRRGQAVILVKMFAETFLTDVIVCISKVMVCLTLHRDSLQYQSQFVDTDNIT